MYELRTKTMRKIIKALYTAVANRTEIKAPGGNTEGLECRFSGVRRFHGPPDTRLVNRWIINIAHSIAGASKTGRVLYSRWRNDLTTMGGLIMGAELQIM